jgi:hypothetical protein
MSRRKVLVAAAFLAAVTGTAQAQVSRVFVSVQGNDGNVCSNVATPCRTLAGGITQVDAEGEVIVIESGSYAGGTIAKSVRINVPAGVVAFSGLPIVINPGMGGTVVLRGLTLKSATAGSGTGITHSSGTLFLENMVVDGWQVGLNAGVGADQLFVKGSVFRNQSSDGLAVNDSTTSVVVDDSFFERNGDSGIAVLAGKVRVSNSVLSANGGGGVLASGANAVVAVQRCEATGNFVGFMAQGSGRLRVSHSTITHNTFGLSNSTSTLFSYGNNLVAENGSQTTGTISTGALQ